MLALKEMTMTAQNIDSFAWKNKKNTVDEKKVPVIRYSTTINYRFLGVYLPVSGKITTAEMGQKLVVDHYPHNNTLLDFVQV